MGIRACRQPARLVYQGMVHSPHYYFSCLYWWRVDLTQRVGECGVLRISYYFCPLPFLANEQAVLILDAFGVLCRRAASDCSLTWERSTPCSRGLQPAFGADTPTLSKTRTRAEA